MAELNEGALSQFVGPKDSLTATAAGGNPMVQQMLDNMMQQGKQRQSYLEQQQAAYNADLEKYAGMVTQSQTPDSQEAGMWGSMAEAASNVAPTWGNTGAMLGRVGGAYGKNQEMNQQLDIKNQADLTKTRQAEVRAMEAKDQNAAMLKALYGGNKGVNPTIKVVDGKLIKYDPVTDKTEVLSGSQDQIKAKLFQTFYTKAVANEVENPEAYAQQQTERTLGQFGGMTVTGKSNNIPGARTAEPEIVEGEVPGPKGASFKFDVSGLEQGDKDIITRLIKRYQANPNEGTMNQTAQMINQLLAKGSIKSSPSDAAPPAATMTYVDKPKRKMEEATGAEEGKALGAEHSDLNTMASASSQMMGQLDLLKKLYTTPNMPEGQLANEVQAIRSGLKTIGIDVGSEVDAAGLASAIAGKMALITRTADGKNLMPGAMSDFEQKILRSLVPGLEGTADGRAALIDIMQSMAKSRMRFAEEANKMSEANRGILPSEWNTRKQRIMKEEMARLALVNSEIAKRFQGAKQ